MLPVFYNLFGECLGKEKSFEYFFENVKNGKFKENMEIYHREGKGK